MLRKMLLVVCLFLFAALAWVAAPLVAAWQIREAVRSGDTRTLAAKVDWQSVRQSLKSSLGETRKALDEIAQAAGLPKPSLWQRLKAAALPYLADPLIDRYVTAEGAPKLYKWRGSLRGQSATTTTPATASAVTPMRGTLLAGTMLDDGLALAGRLERWSFTSPMRLEIEVADGHTSGRRWFAALELRALSWQLTEMKVLAPPQPRRKDSGNRTAWLG
ncbi:MAG: DUF2939 domain-containing protein [Hyphomicrobiaceae bacterium]